MNIAPFHRDPHNPPTCEYWEEFMTCRCPCKAELAAPGAQQNTYFQKLVDAASTGEFLPVAILNQERASCPHKWGAEGVCRICGTERTPYHG